MSNRYEFTSVCALDHLGQRHDIYHCDHYAGGCEYKNVVTVKNAEYQLCCYPMEDRVEEIGEKLPVLKPEDLQSYFTNEPTESMRKVLEKAEVANLTFAQLVMVVQHGVAGGIYAAACITVTGDGTEHTCYDAVDFVKDDALGMVDDIVDKAWHSYQCKQAEQEKAGKLLAALAASYSAANVKRKDIEYHMEYEPFPGCIVCREADESYTVLDAAGLVEITVRFDFGDDCAPYVFYMERQGRKIANSFEQVREIICNTVNKKLDKRKRSPLAEASVNKVIAYHNQGIPMAFITPEKYGDAPEKRARERENFKKDLEDTVRIYGFGYNQVRGGYVYQNSGADAPIDDENSFIIYGKADRKSEQLLKKIAAELGKKYAQASVGFCDLNGYIYFIHTAFNAVENKPGVSFADTDKPYISYGNTTTCFGDSEIEAYAGKDIKQGITDYYSSFTCSGRPEHNHDKTDRVFRFESLRISRSFAPIEKLNSTSSKLRKRNAFVRYCSQCWDEESQTYHFDQRYNRYF